MECTHVAVGVTGSIMCERQETFELAFPDASCTNSRVDMIHKSQSRATLLMPLECVLDQCEDSTVALSRFVSILSGQLLCSLVVTHWTYFVNIGIAFTDLYIPISS